MTKNPCVLEQLSALPTPSAIMMAGIPASGKSTLAGKLGESLQLPVLSSDAMRLELTGNEEDLSRDTKIWNELYRRAEMLLTAGQSLIVDATHNTLRQREFDSRYYRSMGAQSVVCVAVMIDLATALERNHARTRIVPDDVIEQMHNNLTEHPPRVEDGFDGVIIIE